MGASGADSLNVAASIFMGPTQPPVPIRPFLPDLTRSELLTLLTRRPHLYDLFLFQAGWFRTARPSAHLPSQILQTIPQNFLRPVSQSSGFLRFS
jgi:hypothetical protein